MQTFQLFISDTRLHILYMQITRLQNLILNESPRQQTRMSRVDRFLSSGGHLRSYSFMFIFIQVFESLLYFSRNAMVYVFLRILVSLGALPR